MLGRTRRIHFVGVGPARDQYVQASTKFTGTIQDKRDIDAEIARMNKQVAQLEANVAEYNRALAVSRA